MCSLPIFQSYLLSSQNRQSLSSCSNPSGYNLCPILPTQLPSPEQFPSECKMQIPRTSLCFSSPLTNETRKLYSPLKPPSTLPGPQALEQFIILPRPRHRNLARHIHQNFKLLLIPNQLQPTEVSKACSGGEDIESLAHEPGQFAVVVHLYDDRSDEPAGYLAHHLHCPYYARIRIGEVEGIAFPEQGLSLNIYLSTRSREVQGDIRMSVPPCFRLEDADRT